MNNKGIGSLTPSQVNQINKLASNKDSEEHILVASFNGREIQFSAEKPKVSARTKPGKPVKGSTLAVKTLGLKDREITPVLAQKLIAAWKASEEIHVSMKDIRLLQEHLADSDSTPPPSDSTPPPNRDSTTSPDNAKGSSSSFNTLHSGWNSTSSLDSAYGSMQSLDSQDSAAAPAVPPRNQSKADQPPPLPLRPSKNSSFNKQQLYHGSTTSLDSAKGSSISGSSQSLYSLDSNDHGSLDEETTIALSKEVTQFINNGDYRGAHRQLAQESLQAIKGHHIKDGRWKRFGYKDQVIGNVPLPEKTALKIDGSYIPANKITLHNANYIAIQAPQTGYGGDIWQSAIDSNSSIICDLTGENDKAGFRKGGPIEKYYPTKENREINFNNGVKVKFKGSVQEDGYTKTKYEVTDTSGKARTLRRYNYTEWPDHGVPSEKSGKDSLLKYIKALNIHQKGSDFTRNTMVHCTAGVGRTGTLIVLNEMYQNIQSGKYKSQTEVDKAVFEAIQQGRNDRGPAFVQSDSQIDFIMDIVHTWQDKQSRGGALIP